VTPGADFLAASGAIALAVGAARAFIPITIINDAIGTAVFGSSADDAVVVSAAGFDAGLVAGMELLAAGPYEENGPGVATQTAAGVFVFDTARSLLLWGEGGVGVAPTVLIANLIGATGLSGREIIVIA